MMRWMVHMILAVSAAVAACEPAQAVQRQRILILGASNSWGCVTHCDPVQEEPGYAKQLRALLPNSDIRVRAWFTTGAADWDPESVPMAAQSLPLPVGVWEEGLGGLVNLWELMAKPDLCLWRPDYVITFLGWGDNLRPNRTPPLPPTSPEDYLAATRRIVEGILDVRAIPVLAVDGTYLPVLGPYQDALFSVCSEYGLRCGPDITQVLDEPGHFCCGDFLHPTAEGHGAVAKAFSAWFAEEPRRGPRPRSRALLPRACRVQP